MNEKTIMDDLKEKIEKKMERAEDLERLASDINKNYYRGQYDAYKMVLLIIKESK